MNIKIKELTPQLNKKYNIQEYLFHMIKDSYGLEYTPEYHYDIKNIEQYYIRPERNNFYIAIDTDKDQIAGTAAIRSYDKNYNIKNRTYTPENTASLYRIFTTPEYRHKKIATRLVKTIEEFTYRTGYNEIYLHTQEDSYGALAFWLHNKYNITEKTNDNLQTIHMEKIIAGK